MSCANLKSIDIPKNINVIKYCSFCACTSLSSITFNKDKLNTLICTNTFGNIPLITDNNYFKIMKEHSKFSDEKIELKKVFEYINVKFVDDENNEVNIVDPDAYNYVNELGALSNLNSEDSEDSGNNEDNEDINTNDCIIN